MVNGAALTSDEGEFEALVMDAARGFVTKEQISDFLRSNSSWSDS